MTQIYDMNGNPISSGAPSRTPDIVTPEQAGSEGFFAHADQVIDTVLRANPHTILGHPFVLGYFGSLIGVAALHGTTTADLAAGVFDVHFDEVTLRTFHKVYEVSFYNRDGKMVFTFSRPSPQQTEVEDGATA